MQAAQMHLFLGKRNQCESRALGREVDPCEKFFVIGSVHDFSSVQPCASGGYIARITYRGRRFDSMKIRPTYSPMIARANNCKEVKKRNTVITLDQPGTALREKNEKKVQPSINTAIPMAKMAIKNIMRKGAVAKAVMASSENASIL